MSETTVEQGVEGMPAFLSKIQLQNAAGVTPAEDGNGVWLYRAPEAVLDGVEKAQESLLQSYHSEIRFVLNDGADLSSVKITIEPENPVMVSFYYGDYQFFLDDRRLRSRTELKIMTHGTYGGLEEELPRSRFANNVYRIILNGGPVRLIDVEGDVRPPNADELPPVMMSYGTSITAGARASRAVLSWNALLARELGYDLINLGTPGAAFCETAIADFIASQGWDLAVFELSVNMVGNDFSVETFRERAEYLINQSAASHPEAPVIVISILPYFLDYRTNYKQHETLVAYRATLEEICANSPHDNVHFVPGPDLLSFPGLTQDLLHPSDHGMIEIADNLADRIRAIVGSD